MSMLFGQFFTEPLIKASEAPGFSHRFETVTAVHVTYIFNFVEATKSQCLVLIDRWPDVFTIGTDFYLLYNKMFEKTLFTTPIGHIFVQIPTSN